jgi:ArsR family transcriptional regulator, arsenate/arsenite/antimonite-responsive transcriptional repressor
MKETRKPDYSPEDVDLARFAKALGHPARISIIRHLAIVSTCCFSEVAEILPLADSTVSQHMKELRESGLICGENDPPRVRYSINRKVWKSVSRMMEEFMDIRIAKH